MVLIYIYNIFHLIFTSFFDIKINEINYNYNRQVKGDEIEKLNGVENTKVLYKVAEKNEILN